MSARAYVRLAKVRRRWQRPAWHIVNPHEPDLTDCGRLIPDDAERGAWDTVREQHVCKLCIGRASLRELIAELIEEQRARRAVLS